MTRATMRPAAGRRLSPRRPDLPLRRRVGRPRPVLRRPRLRLARDQLPRLDRLRARLRAAEPRRLGRRRHEGLPRRGRLPAHARLGRRRPARDLRSELRLLHGAAVGDRRPGVPLPVRRREVRRLRHRRRSWAQGDREGVQDLERMMGPPSAAREAYRAGSPYHRLENVRVPLLIAHGERDKRVSPKQSEQLVGRLRQARQDVRVRDLPDRGPWAAARRPAARLLPAT